MTTIQRLTLIVISACLLVGCDFIADTLRYGDTTKEFVDNLLKEDYDKCLVLMALDHELGKNTDRETLRMGLANFRQHMVDSWGDQLEYKFIKSEKKVSTIKSENTPPNTTLVFVEYTNHKHVGIFQVLFDDISKKIININAQDVMAPIPSMTYFWLFGLLALCIPTFNIYVIWSLAKSDLNHKWLKYIAVVCLNIPVIAYTAVNGISFKLIHLQIMGVGYGAAGYLNSYWAFGIPLGGIYWFWKLRQPREEEIELVIKNTQEEEPQSTTE